MELFERANELNCSGRYEEAAEIYDMLLTQNETNGGLLATMGTILIRNEKTLGTGIALLHAAMSNAKGSIPTEILSNLGVAYRQSGQPQKAFKYFEKALKKNPTCATLVNYGNCFVEQGDPEKALAPLRKAIRMDETEYLARWNLSLALLELGEW